MQNTAPDAHRPVALIILDGWGYAPRTEENPLAAAHTPYYDEMCRMYPMTTLVASGTSVGLAENEPGGPEVGHLNIGTGRAAQTDVARIREAIVSGQFMQNDVLNEAFERAHRDGARVHLIGLLSDGGAHASPEALFALLRLAKKHELGDTFIHCILDGVDTPPRTADVLVEAVQIKLADIGCGRIGTLCGRYFAMDNSDRWERTARAFTMMVHGEGEPAIDAVAAVRNSFLRGISDEFIAPVVLEDRPGVPVGTIRNGDLVVFFNHRGDAMRQLVRSISVPEGVSSAKPTVQSVTLTEYDEAFGLPVAFPRARENNTLFDVLTASQIHSLRVTETARVPHLTTLFDGGAEIQSNFEDQIMLPGTTPSSLDHQPESQSFKIADRLIRGLESMNGGFFVANLPAAGLCAEARSLESTILAAQYIDTCLGGILDTVERAGGVAIVTSTHSLCENVRRHDNGESEFGYTTNPVPFHLIDTSGQSPRLRDGGTLADIAPTVLSFFAIDKPDEMTGSDLRVE